MRGLLVSLLTRFDLLERFFAFRRAFRRRRRDILARMRLRGARRTCPALREGYDLVLDGRTWRVGALSGGWRAQDVMEDNFRHVVRALDAARVDHFVVPMSDRFATGIGVASSNRADVMRALRAVDAPNVYVYSDVRASPTRLADCGEAWEQEHAGAAVISLFGVVAALDGAGVMGDEHRCAIQFWSPQATSTDGSPGRDGGGSGTRRPSASEVLVAPVGNPVSGVGSYGRLREQEFEFRGGRHRTAPEFSWYLHGAQCPFPIDVVYTWVDGDDPDWQARRAVVAPSSAGFSADGHSPHRYRSFDELRYSLRSVHQYVPFVRHIYIVTDRQRPGFVDPTSEIVSVVDHADIFSDRTALPTFNSHAIETQLHHIPGLSEHYLYVNDDVFFGRLAAWRTYFTRSGGTRFFESRAGFGLGAPSERLTSVDNAGKNLQQLLFDAVGTAPVRKIKHTPHPQQRSLQVEMERRFADAHDATMRAQVRSTIDVSFAAALHHRYGEAIGRAYPGSIDYRYLSLAQTNLEDHLDKLLVDSFDTLCLNDADVPACDREAVETAVQAFLRRRFPHRAPWELDG